MIGLPAPAEWTARHGLVGSDVRVVRSAADGRVSAEREVAADSAMSEPPRRKLTDEQMAQVRAVYDRRKAARVDEAAGADLLAIQTAVPDPPRRPRAGMLLLAALVVALAVVGAVFAYWPSRPESGEVYEDQFGPDNDDLVRCLVSSVSAETVVLLCSERREPTYRWVPHREFRNRYRRVET